MFQIRTVINIIRADIKKSEPFEEDSDFYKDD